MTARSVNAITQVMRHLMAVLSALALTGACATSSTQVPHPGDEHAGHHGAHHQAHHNAHHGESAADHSHAHEHAHVHQGPVQHRFENAEKWAKVFEDPARDAWQRPDDVVTALQIEPGMRVADIGAATGYFPVRIARAHPDAVVYGVDIEPDMVRYLGERARREGLSNLHAVPGTPDDPKLPEPVDVVLLVDTYHHIEERPAYFERLATSLRPGGRVVVIDFRKGSKVGPPDAHKIAPEQVVDEMKAAGYRQTGELAILPEQYFLIFER